MKAVKYIILGLLTLGIIFVIMQLTKGSAAAAGASNTGVGGSKGATSGKWNAGSISIKTPFGPGVIPTSTSKSAADNLAKYGTSWGAGQAPSWYTKGNLYGKGSTLLSNKA